MDNKEFGKNLEKRTMDFSILVIRLSSKLPNTPEGRAIRNQLTKSATSVGANYREANRARSKADDFRHKIKICESEASETEYGLLLIEHQKWVSADEIEFLKNEINELLALFTSIGKKLRE
ncbi:four helix bundle protein [Rhodohalobacter sp. 614A]|uniref:four helix bundle protein n=1 Tax=Rhodohalobacter sp. 614A TaxID=2908649 RepID=UPI001F436315|nr:four helix bundle protein [Rhodohalobacter sp. 614A]